MRSVSIWIDDTGIRKFPKLQADTTADVLVIGPGVTGLTAAYLLKQAAATVALIERDHGASMDTVHTMFAPDQKKILPSESRACHSRNERLGLISK